MSFKITSMCVAVMVGMMFVAGGNVSAESGGGGGGGGLGQLALELLMSSESVQALDGAGGEILEAGGQRLGREIAGESVKINGSLDIRAKAKVDGVRANLSKVNIAGVTLHNLKANRVTVKADVKAGKIDAQIGSNVTISTVTLTNASLNGSTNIKTETDVGSIWAGASTVSIAPVTIY